MVHIDTKENIIYLTVQQKLTNNDFDQIEQVVDSTIESFGKIRLYYEMKNYKGWTFQAFWRDLYMDLKYRNKVEKIAMIGEKIWEKWLSDAIKPFSGATVRFFAHPQKDQAKSWLER
ncbi:STAS/SEC14 domain-containing protein [Membranicola marinus]|uniref:STAS/SEC14 domain-containing protein n=1 Tax=Membranihabitans marinus TaxID=1227546 RepID=A0A953L636_9BACT|nr:STAS/SEC14 domain-containing protein [Membranihabitans marinus]MBY5957237.1 STAS/SEC14 domain-containing protein [Membranihabitans marinus]